MEVTKKRPRLLQNMNNRSFSFFFITILQKQVDKLPTDVKQIT